MAPHATSPTSTDGDSIIGKRSNGVPSRTKAGYGRSMIPRTDPNELQDLICVGFGPASLAIAVALHDSIEQKQQMASSDLSERMPKVSFLERQSAFAWHAGMQLPGAKMQITWLKDLATFRNPRSQFTFLNYLYSVDRLVQFSNVGTFLPLRIEYEDYMKWCAGWFEHLAAYSQECIEVTPERNQGGPIESFSVKTRNTKTQQIECRRARNVVISVGGKPRIPQHLPQSNARVIHSSSYTWAIPQVLTERERPYRVAVIGGGQSAAEIFHDLHSRYPNSRTDMIIRGNALKPSDDSPFVNETFNPEHVDDLYAEPENVRSSDIQHDKVTNYGVVRIELLEEIYANFYEQRIRHPNPEDQQHHILPFREVTSVEQIPGSKQLRVNISNKSGVHMKSQSPVTHDTLDVDAVIVGAGYERNMHEDLLAGARDLMPNEAKGWSVRRDYSVEFEEGAVADGAGVWLQGCNENTHGLSDTLLSILATRGGELVDSIFG